MLLLPIPPIPPFPIKTDVKINAQQLKCHCVCLCFACFDFSSFSKRGELWQKKNVFCPLTNKYSVLINRRRKGQQLFFAIWGVQFDDAQNRSLLAWPVPQKKFYFVNNETDISFLCPKNFFIVMASLKWQRAGWHHHQATTLLY